MNHLFACSLLYDFVLAVSAKIIIRKTKHFFRDVMLENFSRKCGKGRLKISCQSYGVILDLT